MKRTISILVIVAMMLATVLAIVPASAAEPAGTAITTADEFAKMDVKGTYYLANDITLTATYAGAIFEGTLDGNGKTITLDGVTSAFVEIKGATISNLNLVATYVFDKAAAAGALANYASGTFTNITATVDYSITDENVIASKAVGAIFTEINGVSTLANCVANGTITIANNSTYDTQSNARYAGIAGLVGKCYAAGAVKFADCVNNVTVRNTQHTSPTAGFVGAVDFDDSIGGVQLTFENCVNNGDITGTSGNHCGIAGFVGLIGPHSDTTTTFKNCRNNGTISELAPKGGSASNAYIGGFVGRNYGSPKITVENSVNAGDVVALGGGWSGAGGFIGNGMTHGFDWTTSDPGVYVFKNCVNLGNISGSTQSGGIGGAFKQHSIDGCSVTIENCANFGDITGKSYAGGMIGEIGDRGCDIVIIKNSYNAGNISASLSAGGIAGYINHNAFEPNSENKIEERSPMLFDNCANVGTITSTYNPAEASEHVASKYVAAGIIGRFGDDPEAKVNATITNCVNAGELVNANYPEDVAQITHDYKKTDFKCNDSNICSTAATTGLNKFVKAADAATVDAKIAAIAAAVGGDFRTLEELVGIVKGFEEADYVEGWAAFATALANAQTAVAAPAGYSQTELDALYATLYTAAIEGLVARNATDKTALKAAVETAEQCLTEKDKYTATSFVVMEAALKEAKSALFSANQGVIDAAATALSAAITALVERADFSLIDAVVAECAKLNQDAYVSSSWEALAAAIAAAEEVKNNTNAVMNDVEAAVEAVNAAKNALIEKADTAGLAAKVTEITGKCEDKRNYTAKSYAELNSALKAANNAISSGDVGAEQIKELIAALEAAFAGLDKLGNFDEIDAIIDVVDKYEEKNFTPESWEALTEIKDAIAKAKSPSSKGNISVDDVAELKAALEAAVAGLVGYADFTELDALLASANALVEADYTAESWAAVKTAIAAANDLKAKAGATAPEAKAALDVLKAAIDSLAKVSAPTEPAESETLTTGNKGGCGGVIGATAVVITAVLGLGAVALKKREN
mgnify:CR=1 FL=1